MCPQVKRSLLLLKTRGNVIGTLPIRCERGSVFRKTQKLETRLGEQEWGLARCSSAETGATGAR